MLIVVPGSRKTMSITQYASQKPVAMTFPAQVFSSSTWTFLMVFCGLTFGFGFIKMHSRFVGCHSFKNSITARCLKRADECTVPASISQTIPTSLRNTATFRHLRWKNRCRRTCSSSLRISAAIYWRVINLEALFSFEGRGIIFIRPSYTGFSFGNPISERNFMKVS